MLHVFPTLKKIRGEGEICRPFFFIEKHFFLISFHVLCYFQHEHFFWKYFPFTYWLNGRWFLHIVDRDSGNQNPILSSIPLFRSFVPNDCWFAFLQTMRFCRQCNNHHPYLTSFNEAIQSSQFVCYCNNLLDATDERFTNNIYIFIYIYNQVKYDNKNNNIKSSYLS